MLMSLILFLLSLFSIQHPIAKYAYESMETFGGCRDDFMLVVHQTETDKVVEGRTEKHLFSMLKPMVSSDIIFILL